MARRGASDLLVALIGFSLVLSAVFIAGRYFLPSTGLDIAAAVQPVPPDDQSGEPPAEPIDALRLELASMEGSGAIIEFAGAVEGRFVLEGVEILSEPCFDCFEDHESEPSRVEVNLGVDLGVRFSGTGSVLTMFAGFVEVGVPRTEGMTLNIAADRISFSPRPGQCTLEILRSEHFVYESSDSSSDEFLWLKSLAGELTCVGIEGLGGAGAADLIAVFKLGFEG